MVNVADRILNKFLSSPTGQKLNKEVITEDQKARRKHVQGIERLRVESEEKYPGLMAKEESLRRRVEEKRAAHKEAEDLLNKAIWERESASHQVDMQISRHENLLRDSAHPAIDSFCKEMRQSYEDIRHRHQGGNVKAILLAIGKAGEKAEALKFEAVADVPAAIQDIRDSMPHFTHEIEVELVEA